MATQASAFPRLNPNGTHVVAGERVIVVDRVFDVGPGTSAQWADENQLFYTRQDDGAFMEWHAGAVPAVVRDGFNAFSVGGRNRWAGYSAARGVVEFDNGHVEPGWSGPALSSDPSVWAAVIHATGEIVTSHGRPQRFADRDCRDLRWCGRALVWNVYVLGRWQVAGCREPGAIVDLLNIEPEEFSPVPLLVNGELWLMTHSHNRLLLRPWGSRTGYVVATGITNTPDAKQLPNGRVRIVWDAGNNVLEDFSLDPSTRPMVSLEQPSAPQPERLPEGTEIDLLPFLVGQPETWPRDGDHYMHQVWDGRNLTWLKFGPVADGSTLGDAWERLVLDGDQFYLREDRSQSGAGIYSFHPGRWLKRRMKVGEYVNVPENILQRYEKGTCRVVDQHSLPYRVGLIEAWKNYDCGPSLGIRDVIKIDYDPGSDRDTQEFQWHAFGAGWFQFRERRQDGTDASHTTRFATIGGTPLTPTQGCWRRDLVPWPPSTPKPPDPKPPDPPKPDPKPEPVMSEVSLQTFNRSNWIVAEDGGGQEGETTHGRPKGLARADRTAPGPWETFTFKRGADGRVGFRAPNGGWLSAQPDGTLVFNRHKPDDFEPGAWEAFSVEGALEGGISLVTDHGTRVRAINAGGSELRHDVRESAGIDETFFPSVSLTGGTGGGGHVGGGPVVLPPSDLDRIDGQLGIEPGGGFHVNGRPVLPTLCHYGDAFSRWTHGGRDEVLGWLDVMASLGYHGIRFWSTLGPGSDFWAGREVYEGGTPNYWDQLREFLSALRDRGLVCQISQGDLRDSVIPNRRAFAETMAQVVGEVGPPVVALFEGLNEAWQNGEPDPWRLAEFVGAFKARRPDVLVGLSTAQFEGQDEHNAWCIDPANVYIHHSFRGLHWNNKVEHIWSTPYEDRPRRRQGWQGEPAGPGDDVSASDHKEELDDDALCAMAIAALMTRQAWVYFSGPGVRSNRQQRFDQMPGFHAVPKVRALLPPDIGRYQSIWHGGEGKPWSALRIFGALPGTRCEHTYHDPDGRFVVLAYGEAPGRVPQLRSARIDLEISFGSKARLIVGQAA